jgi:hypothetical protein
MEWIAGAPLDEYIEQMIREGDTGSLELLA